MVFAGGDTVTMNHPREGREQSRGCSPMGWHQSCSQHHSCPTMGLLHPLHPTRMGVLAPWLQGTHDTEVRCCGCLDPTHQPSSPHLPKSVPTVWSEWGPVPHVARLARPRTHL